MRVTLPALACVLSLLDANSIAAAEPVRPPAARGSQCFLRNFENWKAPDAKTIYIRVNLHQYYRLDLASTYSALLWPDSHLVTKWRGSDWVCSALDWDLKVSQGFHSISTPCIVKSMTALTAAEAAEIPRKFRP